MISLAINRDSFHFKYYQTLRSMWDLDSSVVPRMSLCIYSQFIFWFSIITLTCSPFILMGWLTLKLCRFLYKVCSFTKIGSSVTDFLDRIIGLGDIIEDTSDHMRSAPAKYLILTSFVTLGLIIVAIGIIGGILYGSPWVISFIIKLPFYLVVGLFGLFLGLFYVFCVIGFVLTKACFYLMISLKVTLTFLAAAAVAIIVGIVLLGVSSLLVVIAVKAIMASEKLKNFLGFKLNGFQKAREEAIERKGERVIIKRRENRLKFDEKERIKREKDIVKKRKKRGEIEYTAIEKFILSSLDGLSKFFEKVKEKTFEKTVKIKGVTTGLAKGSSVTVMGFFGIVWNTLKSIKDGVCPYIEFVDNEDIIEEGE